LQNSPLESSCVVVALIENYNTSKPLKKFLLKNHKFWVVTLLSQMRDILGRDTVVANERYEYNLWPKCRIFNVKHGDTESNQWALKISYKILEKWD
jgi:hypothetical protein